LVEGFVERGQLWGTHFASTIIRESNWVWLGQLMQSIIIMAELFI